jgi:hypothetical protein
MTNLIFDGVKDMRKLKFLGMLVFVIASIALLGGLVTWLWNAVIPDLFVGAQRIDYLHAIGLLALCRILFGGFRGHGRWHDKWHGHRRWDRHARWEAMTPEEREHFARGPWRWCKGPRNEERPKRDGDL